MMSKWEHMDAMSKMSYILWASVLIVIPAIGLSVNLFNNYLMSVKTIYSIYMAVMLIAAGLRQWKVFFGIMIGSLFISSLGIFLTEICTFFL